MKDEIMRLPCTNIGEFIDGKKVYYTIKGHSGLDKGDEVDLYKEDFTYRFEVGFILNIRGNHALALIKPK